MSNPGNGEDDQPIDRAESISIIVAALIDKFGDNALAIAEGQAANAKNETFDVWLKVVARLLQESRIDD